MLFGDVIRRLEDRRVATDAVLRVGDPGLLAEMEARAEDASVSLGAFVAWASFRLEPRNPFARRPRADEHSGGCSSGSPQGSPKLRQLQLPRSGPDEQPK
ncbi:MAG: hypothetical protein NUV72_00595 [Bauldia sp.]|nr:hypothetical protein [Bauldia sp.]